MLPCTKLFTEACYLQFCELDVVIEFYWFFDLFFYDPLPGFHLAADFSPPEQTLHARWGMCRKLFQVMFFSML